MEELKSPVHKIEILSKQEEILSAYSKYHRNKTPKDFYSAYYHGGLNKFITDPKWMNIHFQDKMVHQGLGIFDTVSFREGHIYNLGSHLDRFFRSMKTAKFTPPKSREEIKEIIFELVGIGGPEDQFIRYWCSRGGMGDMGSTTNIYIPTVFYALGVRWIPSNSCQKGFTSPIPMKSKLLSEMKTTNYLINCLAAQEAEEQGGLPIQLRENGDVAESDKCALGFILDDGSFFTPTYSGILESTTLNRLFILMQPLIHRGEIKGIRRGDMSATQLKLRSREVMQFVGDTVIGLRTWDDIVISQGLGPITRKFQELLKQDYTCLEVAIPVPRAKL